MNIDAIAKAYARRIKRGDITIDEVPDKIKSTVEKIISDQ